MLINVLRETGSYQRRAESGTEMRSAPQEAQRAKVSLGFDIFIFILFHICIIKKILH